MAKDCKVPIRSLDEQDVDEDGYRQDGFFLAAFECQDCRIEEAELASHAAGCRDCVPRIQQQARKTRVNLGVDSCAAATVIPRKTCSDYPVRQDAFTGRLYTNASAKHTAEEGQRELFAGDEDDPQLLRARVADVVRPLLAVYDLCKTNHRVIFELDFDEKGNVVQDHSHLLHRKTHRKTPLTLKNRTWDLSLDVRPYSPFGGQAAWP